MDGKCSTCILLPNEAIIEGPLIERALFIEADVAFPGDTNGEHREGL